MDDDEIRRIANSDQATEASKDMAKSISEFYLVLRERQVSEVAAIQFTLLWIQYIFSRAQNG